MRSLCQFFPHLDIGTYYNIGNILAGVKAPKHLSGPVVVTIDPVQLTVRKYSAVFNREKYLMVTKHGSRDKTFTHFSLDHRAAAVN